MDYCSSCRRDLNGALVCPGCGAYAPDIAPPAHRRHGGGASTVTACLATDGQDVRDRGAHPGGALYVDVPPAGAGPDGYLDTGDADSGVGDDAGISGEAATGQGRAARRRQLARWRKHRRRAAAATAVALVGGGLTFAALSNGKPSASHAQASAPPEPASAATPSGSVSSGGAPAEVPDTAAQPRPGADRPAVGGGRQGGARAVPPPADAEATTRAAGQPESAAPHEPARQRTSTVPRTSPPSAPQAPADTPATPAPGATSPPPAAASPGPAAPPAGLLPTAPGESPVQVCLVGLCIG
ncbi:SCO2400 family protein [Streptomyces sp. WMMC940]|uniref:SCO2400 family protein n=1 Tax=Streptomyces sp. WMMC940 TaxID=3015153 RepID=UPI003FCDD2DD